MIAPPLQGAQPVEIGISSNPSTKDERKLPPILAVPPIAGRSTTRAPRKSKVVRALLESVFRFSNPEKLADPTSDVANTSQQQDLSGGGVSKETSFDLQAENLAVVEGLGEGGFGAVVLVVDSITKRRFAMKCVNKVKPKGRTERVCRETLTENELWVLQMIPANPFVLRCHLAFETPTTVNMVCDLVEGGDLYFHLKFLERTRYQQGFFETQAVGILAELVLALGHLHRHNFLHRDLKIENIMLDGNGHVKLIDFGLACELTRNAASKNPDVPAGLYHPPEMLRVKPQERRVGCFTDWFSLGVVAFEVLMGVAQWSNLDTYYEDVEDAVQKLCTRPPYTIRTKNAGPFVARLLSRNYKRRLGTKGTAQVMKDLFFAGVDWEAMAEGRSTPGYVPDNFSMREVCKQRECAESLEKYRTFVEAQQAESSKPQQQSRSSWWTIARSLERVSTLPSIRLPYGDLGDETGGPGEHQ